MAASNDETPPWFLYVLRCADGSLYTGITNDLERRVAKHQAGTGSRYTSGRLPVERVASWPYGDRSSASRAEWAFKRLRRSEKALCVGDPDRWRAGQPARAVRSSLWDSC